MEEELYGASSTDPRSIAGMGVLNSLSGGRGDLVQQYVNEAVPLPKKADPYVAALKFFIEMGKQASQPGATVLGSITGSMGAPVDYLEAKALERQKAEQARSALGLQIAPSLKPPAATKAGYTNVTVDGIAQVMTPTEIQAAKAAGKVVAPYDKPPETSYTFKERKFYKTGLPAAVVKNETDAALFESGGWSAVPPDGWSETLDGGGFETQSSQILDSGLIVFAGKDGTSKVVRAGTNEEITGNLALAAIREAEERGIRIQTERAGGRQAATVAVNTSLSAFDQVGKSRANIANLEEAKRLVLEEGANTGFIADNFPSWKDSTIALDTVKNKLGLDVVGSVTFGALSQGELTLALNTALPTKLDEAGLVDWIDRKISAQGKLQDYLYAQAIYLADGDKTIGDWLRSQKAEQEERNRIEAELRQSGTNLDFTTMPADKIVDVDINTLNATQLAAWNKRMDELGL
jgi:hypothetical protein